MRTQGAVAVLIALVGAAAAGYCGFQFLLTLAYALWGLALLYGLGLGFGCGLLALAVVLWRDRAA